MQAPALIDLRRRSFIMIKFSRTVPHALAYKQLTKLRQVQPTAIFIMIVSPAVLAHDVSARASDVSLAGFTRYHSKNWETVKWRQRSISVQPITEKVKSLKHVKLRVDT